jgi:PST family polysaccharide transporter
MIITARLFSPKDFGVIGAVAVVSTFLGMFVESGLAPAIINQKSLSSEDRNGIFTFTIMLGTIVFLILLLSGDALEQFYKIEGVSIVTKYVAVSAIFSGASIYPTATLNRDKKFLPLAIAGIISNLISLVIVIVFVKIVPPIHALASKNVTALIINFIMTYYFSKMTELGQAKLGSKISGVKPLLRFSLYQFGFNFINFFSRNLDNILVGRYLGSFALGIYDKAYQIMRYPLMLLTFAMTPAIQPIMREYAHNPHEAEKIHRSFVFKLSWIGIIAGFLVALFSKWIILVLLGEKWLEVVPIIRILALSIPIQVVLSTSGAFFQAMNRTDILFISGFLSTILMVSAILYGVLIQGNMIMLSWNLLIAFAINFFQAYYFMYKYCFNQNILSFYRKLFLPILTQIVVITFFLTNG